MLRDVFPLNREFKRGGFYISPLATVSIGNKETGQYSLADTSYAYEVIGRGKWGYGLELGWFHSFENPRLIHYLEGAISYRMFQGHAEHEGTLDKGLSTTNFSSENDYKVQLATAVVRAVNAKQLGKFSFLHNALGINFNYRFSDSYERSSTYPYQEEERFMKQSVLQLHYQLGVGFRLNRTMIVMPTIETPLITAYPSEDINPAFPFFSVKYHPLIIGVRFMFLREDPMNCNAPVYEGIPQ
jgi:hypothetical protein